MNKLKKDFAFQLAYRLLTVITPLITSPYLSRTLGPEKLGIYSGTYAYANYYTLFAILGIEFFGNRSIAVVAEDNEKRRQCFWNIYAIQLGSAIASITIYYLTFGLLFDSSRRVICLLQGLWVIASGLDINWYFFGKQDFKLTVTRNIMIKAISIVCIFAFVHNVNDLPIYVFIMAFSMVFSQGILWFFLFRDIGFAKPDWREVKNNIRPILFLFIPVLAMSVFHIMDKTMVDMLSNEANGGYYYNVDRLVNIPLGLITGLGTVMLPRISKLSHDNDSTKMVVMLGKSSELSLFLTSAISFGLGAIANTFVPVFFGPGYEPCIRMVEAFVPIIVIKAMSDFIRQQYLIPSKKDRLYVIAVFCGAAVNLVANYFLILQHGALGAVLGTFIAEATVLIIELVGTRKEIGFIRMFSKSGAYIVIGILMFVGVRLTESFVHFRGIINLAILICSGGLIYFFFSAIYWIRSETSIFKPYIKK